MRLKLHSTVPTVVAFATIGLILQLDSPRASAQIDAESAIRGSLGASLTDLDLDNPLGALSFCLNGAFALLCAAAAMLLLRANSRQRHGTSAAVPPMHRVRLHTTLGD